MAVFSWLDVMKDQWSRPKPVIRKDLTGKTVVVLGANIGLGFEAAKHFATMNPGKLILACRNKIKGDEAVANIGLATGCTAVELRLVDLADFSSVRAFAERINKEESRLDILVANAAVAALGYEATKDGWETTLQINHLATSLLCLLLVPKMVSTGKEFSTTPRLVVVSSGVHMLCRFEEAVIKSENITEIVGSKEYCTEEVMKLRYPVSKLFNVFFVRAFDSHLPVTCSLVINTVSPGYCYSGLRRNFRGIRWAIDTVREIFLALSSEVGSRQLIYAALDGGDEMRGAYCYHNQIREPGDYVLSEEGEKVQERIWSETLRILSKVDPQVQEIAAQYLNGLSTA